VVNNASAITQRTYRPAPPQEPREEREIESWLGELRGGPATPPPPQGRPSADATRAMPESRPNHGGTSPEKTTAIPVHRPNVGGKTDPESTQKLPNPGGQERSDRAANAADQPEGDPRQRRGGGLSAQDLLRREGRL
jgi:RND superfamily putative drug exporter